MLVARLPVGSLPEPGQCHAWHGLLMGCKWSIWMKSVGTAQRAQTYWLRLPSIGPRHVRKEVLKGNKSLGLIGHTTNFSPLLQHP